MAAPRIGTARLRAEVAKLERRELEALRRQDYRLAAELVSYRAALRRAIQQQEAHELRREARS